jgi:hypothetical protein
VTHRHAAVLAGCKRTAASAGAVAKPINKELDREKDGVLRIESIAAASDNLWPLAANMKRHISIAVPFWPSSCKRNVRERGCRVNSGTVDAQATAQPGCEKTPPGQPLRKLSLPVANLAINLGPLVSPIQQGEMHELFIKRKSSKA